MRIEYCIREGEGVEKDFFTIGDMYEAHGLDVRRLTFDEVNRPCEEMAPSDALKLVNKWNRESSGALQFYLEENPAWL